MIEECLFIQIESCRNKNQCKSQQKDKDTKIHQCGNKLYCQSIPYVSKSSFSDETIGLIHDLLFNSNCVAYLVLFDEFLFALVVAVLGHSILSALCDSQMDLTSFEETLSGDDKGIALFLTMVGFLWVWVAWVGFFVDNERFSEILLFASAPAFAVFVRIGFLFCAFCKRRFGFLIDVEIGKPFSL